MRYSSYKRWAGFEIPGFPEDEICLSPNLKADYIFYTKLRITDEKDFKNLLYLSVSEAAADNVKVLEGMVSVDLCAKCGTPSDFVIACNDVKEKFRDSVNVRINLMVNSSLDNNLYLAETFLENCSFDGLCVTGSNFYIEKIQQYKGFFEAAKAAGIRNGFSCDEIVKTEDLKFCLETFKPEVIKDPVWNICDAEITKFLKDNNVAVVFSPFLGIDGSGSFQKKAELMRSLADTGIDVKICSDSALFMCKSISEFAADLCNTGLFSKEEIETLFKYE